MEPKVDFSKFSKVQASLKERLLAKYDEKQQLADDELDMVAAASISHSGLFSSGRFYSGLFSSGLDKPKPSHDKPKPSHTW